MTQRYAIFHNDKQVSRSHPTKDGAAAEAFSIGAVVYCAGRNRFIRPGYRIATVDDSVTPTPPNKTRTPQPPGAPTDTTGTA